MVSEIARPNCAPKVAAWAEAQSERSFFISILTLAEFDQGIHNLPPDSPARAKIAAAVDSLADRFSGRVLSLDDKTVRRWGEIAGTCRRVHGIRPPVIDAMIAATALEHGLYLATRNVKDVRTTGAAVFDPWNDDPAAFPIVR